MRYRRQDDDWIWLVAQVIGVLLLFGLISPQTRQMIFAVGFLAVCAVSLAGTGLIGFSIYRFVTWSQREEKVEPRVDWNALGVAAKGEQRQPQTSTAPRTAENPARNVSGSWGLEGQGEADEQDDHAADTRPVPDAAAR